MRSVVTVKLVNGLAAQICSVGGAARVGAIRVSTPMRTWKKGTAVASTSTLDNVINLCKRRGFVFPCGEIYGGTRAAWDYGPFGVELKENIKRQWWRAMVTRRDDVVGLDSSVILPREVWVASGHVGVFNDPLTECLSCHKRMRADHLQEGHAAKHGIADPDSISLEEVNCPNCGNKGQWTEPRDFNMMLKTYLGPVEDKSGLHYLRPETAQGIFVNFQNVLTSARKKPPFGIAQTGKSFRNEITPGNFIFRTREFEQMEMEFFVEPGTDEEWHQYWIDDRFNWYIDLGINFRYFFARKTMFVKYTQGFVALPGGIGTLEELVEQLTWQQLGRHSKPILLANIDNFWEPLLSLLSHMRTTEFIRPTLPINVLMADRVDDILPRLRSAVAGKPAAAKELAPEVARRL